MSFLTTTQTLTTRHPLPPRTTSTHAISLLQTPSILLRLDPDSIKYEESSPPNNNAKAAQPDETKHYTITNKLPGALGFGREVSYNAAITNTPEGVKWDVSVTMGVKQESVWKIVSEPSGEAGDGEGDTLWLVEETEISGNRFLVGIVRGMVERSRGVVHGRFGEACVGKWEGEKGEIL